MQDIFKMERFKQISDKEIIEKVEGTLQRMNVGFHKKKEVWYKCKRCGYTCRSFMKRNGIRYCVNCGIGKVETGIF